MALMRAGLLCIVDATTAPELWRNPRALDHSHGASFLYESPISTKTWWIAGSVQFNPTASRSSASVISSFLFTRSRIWLRLYCFTLRQPGPGCSAIPACRSNQGACAVGLSWIKKAFVDPGALYSSFLRHFCDAQSKCGIRT